MPRRPKDEGAEIEIGSIGVQFEGWHWGIDNIVPVRKVSSLFRPVRVFAGHPIHPFA